jgi:hypothetical protein
MPSCAGGSAQHPILTSTSRRQRVQDQGANEGYFRFNIGKERVGLMLSYPR